MQSIIDQAVRQLRAASNISPKAGLILGSGLGAYADTLDNKAFVEYASIEGFPSSKVEGHAARFVIGEKNGLPVIAMQGRVHYYEGHPQSSLALGVRIMRQMGAEYLLLTNAAGGVNTSFRPGMLMLIADHINFSGGNPLIGDNLDALGPRFPDMSNAYDEQLRARVKVVAADAALPLEEGIYMMFSGPSYETPAEIRMARTLGADAVGMSTVPEAIAASHCGMKTLGISLITNMAAGILKQKLSHEEVQQAATEASARFTTLVDSILERVFQ